MFRWSTEKFCWAIFIDCKSCHNASMHLSHDVGSLMHTSIPGGHTYVSMKEGVDIDSLIFYSVPTSFFTLDERIDRVVRELVSEAEGCLKMNYLTGASACIRKAIYELLLKKKAVGDTYEDKIKSLKDRHPDSDPAYFDTLADIQGMTSDKIHEQSWPKWDSSNLKVIIETLKSVLHDIDVLPQIKRERSKTMQQMRAEVRGKTPGKKIERSAEEDDSEVCLRARK